MNDPSRDRLIDLFKTLDDADFDVHLDARTIDNFLPRKSYPLRVVVRPVNRDTLKKLEGILDVYGYDYSADSLTSNHGGGVTFNIFQKGARSYPV